MQVFKTFALITKKNLGSLLIYFGIFLFLTILFTKLGAKDQTQAFSQEAVPIAIFDDDGSELSQGLSGYLGGIHEIVDIERDEDAVQDEIFYRNVEYVLTIPEGYGDSFTGGNAKKLSVTKIPGSSSGQYVDGQIGSYLKKVSAYMGSGSSMKEALAESEDDLKKQATVTMTQNRSANEWKESIFYFFLYLEYIFTACMISGLGILLVAFNRKEVNMRIKCSAMPLRSRNLQILLGCVCFTAALWLLYMVAAAVIYGGDLFSEKGLYYMLNSLVLMLVCMALAFLCSQFAKDSDGLTPFSNVLGLGFAFLGGVFVQQNLLSDSLLAFSRFLPSYWYVKAVNTIERTQTFTGSSLASIRNDLLIQLGFAAAIFAVGLAVTKRKSQAA